MVHTQSARVRAQHSQMPVDTVAAHAAQQTARARARTLTNTRPLRAHIAYICAHARVWHRNAKNAISLFIWRLPVVGASTAAQQHRRRRRCRRSRPKTLKPVPLTRAPVSADAAGRSSAHARSHADRQTPTDRPESVRPRRALSGQIARTNSSTTNTHTHTKKNLLLKSQQAHTRIWK